MNTFIRQQGSKTDRETDYIQLHNTVTEQERLAAASIARDDPSTLPAMILPSRPHASRPQCAVNWDRNLKPKLAIMRQCTFVTDRRTDGH